MKTGDFVGWEDSWDDELGCEISGLIIYRYIPYEVHGYSEYFDVLESATGSILYQVPKEVLVVMFESQVNLEKIK